MRALYLKELRALWAFFVLCFLFNSGDVLYRPFLEPLDQMSWLEISGYVTPGHSWGFELVILVFVVAFAAFPREHDERTMELLYSLPIGRPAIFAAKAAAGLTVLFGTQALLLTTDAIMSNLSRESWTGGQWRPDVALALFGLQIALVFIVYAHGLLASVLRLFGVIPYLLLLLIASTLDDALPPLRWVDPTEILAPRYEGTTLVIPWAPIAAHLAFAIITYGLAYAAWMGPAESIGKSLVRLRESVLGKIAFGCVGLAVVSFIGLIALGVMIGPSALEDEEREDHASFETSRRDTERFTFTYPTSLEARAAPLMDDADRLHEELGRVLETDAGPRLIADLTDASPEHLGISSWTHVRVGLATEHDPERLRRTFTHETAHAFQHRLTQLRTERDARFFIEGSAEYLSFAIVPGDELLGGSRRIAAATWLRHRMRFEDLADDDRLRGRLDTALVYPLGELWTAALVRAHGPGSIGDVLRALGRDDAPRDLDTRAYWESTLRAAGCDLETVLATFEAMVREIEAAEHDAIERL
ncbi:MAG: hypothetical protein K8H88_12810, partial [Sandaracinaceae bacterium]|nr:hypothetical protein [Sandaracinaceae bacterium]